MAPKNPVDAIKHEVNEYAKTVQTSEPYQDSESQTAQNTYKRKQAACEAAVAALEISPIRHRSLLNEPHVSNGLKEQDDLDKADYERTRALSEAWEKLTRERNGANRRYKTLKSKGDDEAKLLVQAKKLSVSDEGVAREDYSRMSEG